MLPGSQNSNEECDLYVTVLRLGRGRAGTLDGLYPAFVVAATVDT